MNVASDSAFNLNPGASELAPPCAKGGDLRAAAAAGFAICAEDKRPKKLRVYDCVHGGGQWRRPDSFLVRPPRVCGIALTQETRVSEGAGGCGLKKEISAKKGLTKKGIIRQSLVHGVGHGGAVQARPWLETWLETFQNFNLNEDIFAFDLKPGFFS